METLPLYYFILYLAGSDGFIGEETSLQNPHTTTSLYQI